jgi:formamidopyrimidine-DNA glycosylase
VPELPEVETIRLGLERQIVGAEILEVQVHDFPGVIEGQSVDQFRTAIRGQIFTGIRRRGKYLLLDLRDELAVMVHLRMTGQLLVEQATMPPTRFERLKFTLSGDRELRFADQRKFGRVALLLPEDVNALDRKLGIEPLDSEFTSHRFAAALARRSGAIKAVLLDQSLIAGVGNIYADEALFRARIHPQTPAKSLTAGQISGLHRDLRFILTRAIDQRGTSFSSYRDSSGQRGSNQFLLQVYGLGRCEHPCPRCGSILSCITISGRSSHFCPSCQPLINCGRTNFSGS